jgi:hypothetical protein
MTSDAGKAWVKILDSDELPAGDYEVSLVAGATGFRVFRIERGSGKTWFKLDGKWVLMKEP